MSDSDSNIHELNLAKPSKSVPQPTQSAAIIKLKPTAEATRNKRSKASTESESLVERERQSRILKEAVTYCCDVATGGFWAYSSALCWLSFC